MRIDIDRYREILDTLTRNKSRSFLTGFGVFWGVFMLIGMIGSGKGLKEMLSQNFEGFATNTAIIFPQSTTKAYQGFKKGRSWDMVYQDVDRLRHSVPELDAVVPMLTRWETIAVFDDKKVSCNIKGISPDYTKVEQPKLYYGRYINQMDVQLGRKICVIGKKIYKTLFPGGGDPCDKYVRIDSTYYHIVGVDYNSGKMNINGSAEESVVMPISLIRQAYNFGNGVHIICITGKPGVKITGLVPRIRTVIARAHNIDPTDEKAVSLFNTEVMFGMVDSLFSGVNFLIWLVGIGTLLAGAIGVSNIMMVTVRERTTEIGIRRAIGATPHTILTQIISESIVLIAVAGMSGILFAVLILQMLQLGNTTDGITTSHFQIGFWTALGAVALLGLLGILAGLVPALRAMSIKPVDAMRDE